ncbi:MAG: adenylyltransferase/cytidyltransferase family protein, partial [Candidatus Omnitrophica bacterium]|nr:adenylyltransferase/cytidyltransferase family protein [Candidatus Omnitrophota bacterium]
MDTGKNKKSNNRLVPLYKGITMVRDIKSKIKSIDELCRIIRALKKKGSKIAHCHGVFDLLHPGHIKHFEAARKEGDILVVTITKDKYVNKGPGRPVFNQNLRAESIAAIECVDFVAINEWPTAVETIKLLKPHFYIKGQDYARKEDDLTGKITEEERAIKSISGSMLFTDELSFSSSSLINTFFTPFPEEAKDFFAKFRKRYLADNIIKRLKEIGKLKVLVIGDIIIDEYHYCSGMGKSQKDNIIATKYLSEEVFAGGVLAAANHLAGFCRDVTLATCIGTKNEYKDFITKHLKPNIKTNFYYRDDAPTVVKRRFVDPNFLSKLFEICYLEDANKLPANVEKSICDYLRNNLRKFDMALVADFGHGLITSQIVKVLCKYARFMAVNVQTNSSNIGFNLITKFNRADYICIDEPELRLACHDKLSDLRQLVLKIKSQIGCERIIITRGHKGSLVYSKKEGFNEIP